MKPPDTKRLYVTTPEVTPTVEHRAVATVYVESLVRELAGVVRPDRQAAEVEQLALLLATCEAVAAGPIAALLAQRERYLAVAQIVRDSLEKCGSYWHLSDRQPYREGSCSEPAIWLGARPCCDEHCHDPRHVVVARPHPQARLVHALRALDEEASP